MKSFSKQLNNLSEKTVTAENADCSKIFAMVHNQTDGLKMPTNVGKERRFMKNKTIKALAASLVAVMVLTIGVGAFNSWDYRGLFGMLFSSGEHGELHEIPHTIRPQVSNMINNSDNLEIDILGIAGDNQNIHIIAKLIPKNGYIPNTDHYSLIVSGFTSNVNFIPAGDCSVCTDVVYFRESQEQEGCYCTMIPVIPQTIGFGSGGFTLLGDDDDGIIVSGKLEYYGASDGDGYLGGLESGYIHMGLQYWEVCFDTGFVGEPQVVMTFDLLVDYDFSVMRTVEINNNWIKHINITPISVRFTIFGNIYAYNENVFKDIKITFKDGDTLNSCSEGIGTTIFGGNADNDGNTLTICIVPLSVPFDVNEVYSITVNDVEIVL
jgi:hypothetical protein